jgi:hypothetical protein
VAVFFRPGCFACEDVYPGKISNLIGSGARHFSQKPQYFTIKAVAVYDDI